jgi:CubicO group peptidase (beta-lactamase class C family)
MGERGFTKAGLERLRDCMRRYVDDGSHPGLVWMVARPGNVHVDAVGVATLGEPRPMARDTIFRISSMTKPVTAVAAMLLVEDCLVRLDDPVDELLPELADRQVLRTLESEVDDTVPATRAITLRDLLTFQSGYGMIPAPPGSLPILRELDARGMGAGPPRPGEEPDLDAWISRFAGLPLAHQPGDGWLYHTGADILGALIARATGRPLGDFLRDRVFEPLGMRDTGFHVGPADIGRLATCYWTDPVSGSVNVFDAAAGGQWSRPPRFPSGGAGLVSTVDDFHTFSVMLASGGRHRGERLLSRPTVELMVTDHLGPAHKAGTGLVPGFWDSNGWGFGMSVVTKRTGIDTTPGRFGWDGGLGTAWSVDRSEQLVAILMTQQAWSSPAPPAVVRDFRTSAYAALDD